MLKRENKTIFCLKISYPEKLMCRPFLYTFINNNKKKITYPGIVKYANDRK